MFPSTRERVRSNTRDEINQRIRQATEARVTRLAKVGPEVIEQRLAELDREWDIERCLETLAPTFTLLGLGLGVFRNRKWLVIPAVVQSFFLQHALQGWCPPVPILRRLGVRTLAEIDEERYALKALRGDFEKVPHGNGQPGKRAIRALEAVRDERRCP
jgi:hypothetical protein